MTVEVLRCSNVACGQTAPAGTEHWQQVEADCPGSGDMVPLVFCPGCWDRMNWMEMQPDVGRP